MARPPAACHRGRVEAAMKAKHNESVQPDVSPRRYSNDALRESIRSARRAADSADRTSARVARHIRRAEAMLRYLRGYDRRRPYLG